MYVDPHILYPCHIVILSIKILNKNTLSKILEHPETTENIEVQLMTHDIDEKQIALSHHHSEQSIQREKKYPDQRYYLNSPSRVDRSTKIVQHFKTNSTNKCQNSLGESDTNVTDSNDKGIDISSEESE